MFFWNSFTGMKLSVATRYLEFTHPFRLATGERTGTHTVYVRLSHEGMDGYGEATLPPYLPETQSSVIAFAAGLKLPDRYQSSEAEAFTSYLATCAPGNYAAKCAVETAFRHLCAQLDNPFPPLLPVSPSKLAPRCTFTLGMGDATETVQKLEEASDFPLLKLKLGQTDDLAYVRYVRSMTDKPFCVDVNQGWDNPSQALELAYALKELGVLLIEQPFVRQDLHSHAWLSARSPLPLIADESVQTPEDLPEVLNAFHGINVKILKCGGLGPAALMIQTAQKSGKFVLTGCMSESSCGVYHASQLAPGSDLLDLDGPYLIRNDPFTGFAIRRGYCETTQLRLADPLKFEEL